MFGDSGGGSGGGMPNTPEAHKPEIQSDPDQEVIEKRAEERKRRRTEAIRRLAIKILSTKLSDETKATKLEYMLKKNSSAHELLTKLITQTPQKDVRDNYEGLLGKLTSQAKEIAQKLKSDPENKVRPEDTRGEEVGQKDTSAAEIRMLSRRSRAELEDQLYRLNKRINSLSNGLVGAEDNANDETTLEKTVLERQRAKVVEALIARNLDNTELAAKIVGEGANDDEDLGILSDDQEFNISIKKLVRKIHDLRDEISAVSLDANEMDQAELSAKGRTYLLYTEQLRLAYDELIQTTRAKGIGAETTGAEMAKPFEPDKKAQIIDRLEKTLSRSQGALAYEQAQTLLEILPPSELAILRKKIENSENIDTESIRNYLLKLQELGVNVEGVENIAGASAEDLEYAFVIASSKAQKAELKKLSGALRKDNGQELIKGGLIPNELKREFIDLQNITGETELAQAVAQKIDQLLAEISAQKEEMEKAGEGAFETLNAWRDLMQSYEATLGSTTSTNARVSQAIYDISTRMTARFAEGKSEVTNQSPAELDTDSDLPYSEIRRIFNMYGIGEVDLTEQKYRDNLVERINATGESINIDSSNGINSLIEHIVKGGGRSAALVEEWVGEASDDANQKERAKIATIFHREVLRPTTLSGKDANDKPVFSAEPEAMLLFNQLMRYKEQIDPSIEAIANDPQKQKELFVKSLLISNIRTQIEQSGKKLDEDEQNTLKQIVGELNLNSGSVTELVSTITSRFNLAVETTKVQAVVDLLDSIGTEGQNGVKTRIEKGPGGFYLVMDNSKIPDILGLNIDKNMPDRPEIYGATLNMKNIANSEYLGGLAIIGEVATGNSDKTLVRKEEAAHIMENMLQSLLIPDAGENEDGILQEANRFKSHGLDELIAELRNFGNDEDTIGGSSYKPNLDKLDLFAESFKLDTANPNREEELDRARTAFLAINMAHDIVKHYRAKTDGLVQAGIVKDVLEARIKQFGSNPEQLIFNLASNFPEVKFADKVSLGDLNVVMDESAKKAGVNTNFDPEVDARAKRIFNQDLFEKYTGSKDITIPGSSETVFGSKSNDVIDRSAWTNNYDFAMHYNGKVERVRKKGILPRYETRVKGEREFGAGETPADVAPFALKIGQYYEDSGFGEMSAKHPLSSVMGIKPKPSAYEEGYNFNFFGPLGNIPVVGSLAKQISNSAIRLVVPFNSRDILTAFPTFGGASGFRNSSRDKQAGQILGRWAELRWQEKRSGAVAKFKYPGHVYPPEIGGLNVEDRHKVVNEQVQGAMQGKVGQNEALGLFERIPSLNLSIVPNDRPSYSDKISTEKLDKISSIDFMRIKNEVFDLKAKKFGERFDYTDYGGSPYSMKVAGINYEIYVDDEGNIVMESKVGNDKTKKQIMSEDAFIRMYGEGFFSKLNTEGVDFYANWRSQEVVYKGSRYYVHYSPHDGMPYLFGTDKVDWSKIDPAKPPKGALYDHELGRYVQPRFAKTLRNSNNERRKRLDMNVAVNGAYAKFIEVRKAQQDFTPGIPEEQLYSLKDLVNSIKNFEDPNFTVDDPPFVRSVNGRDRFGKIVKHKQIFIPDPTGKTEGYAIDYEVAMEMLTRIDRYYIDDSISRQAWVKYSSPEQGLQYEQNLPENTKVRNMVITYLKLVSDENIVGKDPKQLQTEIEAYFKLKREPNPNTAQQKELERLNKVYQTYLELVDFEKILLEGDYSLLDLKNMQFGDGTQSTENMLRFRESLRNTYGAWVDQQRQSIRRTLAGTTPPLSDAALDQAVSSAMERVYADYSRSIPAVKGSSDEKTQHTLTSYIASKFLGSRRLAGYAIGSNEFLEVDPTTGDYINRASTPSHTIGGSARTLDEIFSGLMLNEDYDKRTVTRFMERFDVADRKRLQTELQMGIDDGLKYRQELKDYAIKTMEKSQLFLHEFQKYRGQKTWLESVERWGRKLGYVALFGTLAASVTVTSPLLVYSLLGSLGWMKYLMPVVEKNKAIAANRRNIARELEMKYADQASRIQQMFEEGKNLDWRSKKTLDQMLLDMELNLEMLQSKGLPDGWAPGKIVIWDDVIEPVLYKGEQSQLQQLLNN